MSEEKIKELLDSLTYEEKLSLYNLILSLQVKRGESIGSN